MIKQKICAWLLQSLAIFLFLSIYWGSMFFDSFLSLFSGFLLSIAGILLLPISVAVDLFTKRFSLAIQLLISFLTLMGVSIGFFLAAQGWILAFLYGFFYWLFDLGWKWDKKKKDQIA